MRAREPDHQGRADVDGVGIGYEVFGSGPRTILLAPAWAISNSRVWKAQVPWLARRFRVITFDARGTRRSDRPEDPALYGRDAHDALAVLDATDTDRALLVGLSLGAATALACASLHPEKQVDDGMEWGLDSGREVLERTVDAPPGHRTRDQVEALVAGVRCPVL